MRKSIYFLIFCFATTFHSSAQEGIELGGWVGVAHYFGDLNTNYSVDDPGIAAGLIGRYNINSRLALKLSGNFGMVSASDADSDNSFERRRNLSFRSIVVDGAAQFEFNFLPYHHGSSDEWFSPYLFAGFNVFYFNPQAKINDEWVELRPLGTEGQFMGEEYYSIVGGLIYGGGIKLSMNYRWSVNIEFASRYLFTDYLDDVSGVYPDMEDLEELHGDMAVMLSDRSIPDEVGGQIGQEGRQRGDSNGNDSYSVFGIGLTYYFGDLKCPKIVR